MCYLSPPISTLIYGKICVLYPPQKNNIFAYRSPVMVYLTKSASGDVLVVVVVCSSTYGNPHTQYINIFMM